MFAKTIKCVIIFGQYLSGNTNMIIENAKSYAMVQTITMSLTKLFV